MHVPYLDLKVNDRSYKQKLLKRFENILDHGRIISGPELIEFEEICAKVICTNYALGVSSGSSGLYLALTSLGIGVGDEVITTPYTWVITANAIVATGAKPVFVDVLDDFNIDPNAIQEAITLKTKAIVPMHVAGHMCEMEKISTIAKEYKLLVVEDAAQAFCSAENGRRPGYFSDAAAFSMNPMKILHAYGEAGVVVTNNDVIYNTIKELRHAGTSRFSKVDQQINLIEHVSLNHKIDTLQASLLIEELNRIDQIKKQRDIVADYYDINLPRIGCLPQKVRKNEVHGRYIYLFVCKNRDGLFVYLTENHIECKIFYSPLISDIGIYKTTNSPKIPVARDLLRNSISIPMHENMSIEQAQYVVACIGKFFSKSS